MTRKQTTDTLRRVRLTPYRKGAGPSFTLTMWNAGGSDWRGQTTIGYRLTAGGLTIFEGADFHGSPMHADDSDATIAALLGFLTLRPGDTDREYFADYTAAQQLFCREHAEALACEAIARFGED